jgi:hypothetical protein
LDTHIQDIVSVFKQLVCQQGSVADRTFEIEFLDKSVQAFSFTFG